MLTALSLFIRRRPRLLRQREFPWRRNRQRRECFAERFREDRTICCHSWCCIATFLALLQKRKREENEAVTRIESNPGVLGGKPCIKGIG